SLISTLFPYTTLFRSILKCDQCRDGYLIVKPGKENNYILGCTNYKKDGTGCGRFITPKYYYEMLKLDPDPLPAKELTSATTKSRSEEHTSELQSRFDL